MCPRGANNFNGHGTFENDRPPIFGAIGRESDEVIVRMALQSTRKALEPLVVACSAPDATIMSHEWNAYHALRATGRGHASVKHRIHEWARDDDGVELRVREVNSNFD